jgi:hypothetical protein
MANMAWIMIPSMIVLGVSMAILFSDVPASKWDRATVIGVCGGLPILRQENGTVWLRVSSMRVYRIEDKDKLECR